MFHQVNRLCIVGEGGAWFAAAAAVAFALKGPPSDLLPEHSAACTNAFRSSIGRPRPSYFLYGETNVSGVVPAVMPHTQVTTIR